MKRLIISILLIFSVLFASANEPAEILIKLPPKKEKTESDKTKPLDDETKRNVAIVGGVFGGLYVASMTGLYFAWYADYPQSSFHFLNDNGEWLQMDKMGHAATAYNVGMIGYEAFKGAGLDEKRSIWIGGSLGFVFLTTVEVFDGFSKGWGFSWGDMVANAAGAGLFIGQQFLWHEQRIALKYSFHQTQYAQYRPDLLGKNFIEQTIKDYNGITIWASCNFKTLFLKNDSKFPAWLNIAIGYGADGMTGAYSNVLIHDGKPIPPFERNRRFLLSIDIDLTRIPVHNKFLKYTLKVLSFIKIPMPAIEYSTSGNWRGYWLYF